MEATDVITVDIGAGDRDGSIEVAPAPVASRPAMSDRLLGASLGSLAFQAGQMGARLGWHRSTGATERCHLLETCP